jgi:hypothetical protein
MKKRIRVIMSVLLILIGIILLIFSTKIECCNGNNQDTMESQSLFVDEIVTEITELEESNDSCKPEDSEIENSIEQLEILMNDDIANIHYDFGSPNEKIYWFLEYKKVIQKYPEELHKMTIYEKYSEEELDLLFRIVQAEVGDEYDFTEKINVVSVIFNRCSLWKKSLTEILTQKGEFSSYSDGRYKKVTIDKKTIWACEYVFIFGDTTFGSIAFRSHRACPDKWYEWERQFGDKAHCFYK